MECRFNSRIMTFIPTYFTSCYCFTACRACVSIILFSGKDGNKMVGLALSLVGERVGKRNLFRVLPMTPHGVVICDTPRTYSLNSVREGTKCGL